jgi:signal transduction histidine kinase
MKVIKIYETCKIRIPKIALIIIAALLATMAICCSKHCDTHHDAALIALEQSDSLPPAARDKVLDSLYAVANTAGNDSLNRILLLKLAGRYYNNGSYNQYHKATQNLYAKALEAKDSVQLATSLYYMGDFYELQTRQDSALYYYLQAKALYTTQKDTLNTARMTLNSGGIFFQNGSYAESEAEAINALMLFQRLEKKEEIFQCYVLLGLTLTEVKNYTKAFEYYRLAEKQINLLEKEGYDKRNITHYRASCYNNMGVTYEYSRDYKKAITLYNKGLKSLGNTGLSQPLHAMLLSNRAYANMLMHNITPDVKSDLFEAMRIRDSLGVKLGIVASQIRVGEYYLAIKDTTTGLKYIKEGYRQAKLFKSTLDITHALSLLSVNDRANASYYSNLYFKVNDSLQLAERATRNKFARIAYETDRVESQNKLLSRQFSYTLAAAIALLSFAAGLVIIMRLKVKNKELMHKQHQQQANEKIYNLLLQREAEAEIAKMEERNRLAMDLHDGVLNRIFTTRFNLEQLQTTQEDKKKLLVQELQETQDEIRKLSHDLKESFLPENESYAGALHKLVEKQQEANGPSFELYVDKFINWGSISPERRVAIFRVVQEACTNAIKHSEAEQCNIAVMAQRTALKLRIWDNGKGFDPKKVKSGIGLRNISDRIKALNGTFTIRNTPGAGTVLEIII